MPTGFEKMAHLMRRTACGARPDEIENYLTEGFEAVVDRLVNYDDVPEAPNLPPTPITRDGTFNIRLLEIENTVSWWLSILLQTRRPLRERMVLFWHDHFATAVNKVGAPNGYKYLYWQNLLFRQHATGNFRTLLKAVNRDPAMLWWLDNYLNFKDSPNENYARELMEIFALGSEAFTGGIYTEPDVQQGARAFTGWGLIDRRQDMELMDEQNGPITNPALVVLIPPSTNDNSVAAQRHDYGNKTIFGVNANFNGDDVVDLILDHDPQRRYAARMIGRKLFEHFAYENPEEHIVEHLAAVAMRTNFDIKALLRDLFLNVKEFYSEKAMHALVKWPVYYVVSAVRLLQGSITTGGLYGGGFGGFNVPQPTTIGAMGMVMLNPPDVFGWPGREDWLTTSQLFARMNWASSFTSNRSTVPGNTGIPLEAVLQTAGLGAQATAEQVVDYFIDLLAQTPLGASARQGLLDYLRKNDNGSLGTFTLDAATKDKKVRGLIHLLLACPEAQTH
ncbi:MAG: DUF1800 domain-containing protein [Acidobacteriota bacterium]